MGVKTLDKTETKLIDNFFIRNDIQTFDVPHFNMAICNTLPMWRAEQLMSQNKKSLAYIDYIKNLNRKYKV